MPRRIEQTPVGGTVTIPAGETAEYRYESPDNGTVEFINLVEAVADAADAITMNAYIDSDRDAEDERVPEPMNDGPDNVTDDLATGDKSYPIPVSNIVGDTRYLTAIELRDEDAVVFDFNNTDGSNPHDVTFRASAATTARAAFGGGGGR